MTDHRARGLIENPRVNQAPKPKSHPPQVQAPTPHPPQVQAPTAQPPQVQSATPPAISPNLPQWTETARGTPNSFLRSALFAAIHGKEREYLKATTLASREGVTIRFTGMQLDQSDLDVWEQVVELVRAQPLGHECHFTIYELLKALGRPSGKAQYEWLRDVLRRLAACCVEIVHGRHTYGGSLLEFECDEKTDVYWVGLNPRINYLYQAGWTAINWEIRQKLRRKPLALWLHGYYSSDAQNYDTRVETLHRLSGSKTKELRFFKVNLKTALEDLVSVGFLESYTMVGDLVSVRRQPSASQSRHLARKVQKTDR